MSPPFRGGLHADLLDAVSSEQVRSGAVAGGGVEGIAVMITEAITEITDVVDATDHEAGDNPYFARN